MRLDKLILISGLIGAVGLHSSDDAVVKSKGRLARIEFLQKHSAILEQVISEIRSGVRSNRYDRLDSCLAAIKSNQEELGRLSMGFEGEKIK